MGRPKKEVETEILFDMIEKGTGKKDIAEELGVSAPTLSRRITEIQEKQGLILQYRALQNLHLTELQAKILENITTDKIEEAPLRDLVFAYKVLKDKELVVTGKPTELKGMMHYLIELEKQEVAGNEPPELISEEKDIVTLEEAEDGSFDSFRNVMPKL